MSCSSIDIQNLNAYVAVCLLKKPVCSVLNLKPKIYITPVGNPVRQIDEYHYTLAKRFLDFIESNACEYVDLADGGFDADIVILIENLLFKDREYYEALYRNPVVQAKWPYVFAVNCDDNPNPVFPGVYTSLPKAQFNKKQYVANGYYNIPNSAVRDFESLRAEKANRLCSFIGVVGTHPVRKHLLEFNSVDGFLIIDRGIGCFLNYSTSQKDEYSQLIADSKFVLCPRGRGTSSYRCYETMQMARVPVIISDDWVPPAGGDWDSFSIRVAETDVKKLPEILKRYEFCAEEMGKRAREAWERRFNETGNMDYALRLIVEMAENRFHKDAVNDFKALRHAAEMTVKSQLGASLRRLKWIF